MLFEVQMRIDNNSLAVYLAWSERLSYCMKLVMVAPSVVTHLIAVGCELAQLPHAEVVLDLGYGDKREQYWARGDRKKP